MTKYIGIGAKKILPVPKTPFERDLIVALEDTLREIEDALKNLETTNDTQQASLDDHETRITALEP
jgi:succinate dehydrogenase/fumarate reductase-like Fe-S protein